MKTFFCATALKAAAICTIVGGLATACQNGNSPIGSFLQEEAHTSMAAQNKTNGATAQSEDERKAEQARKIAEFLAKPEVKEMSAGLEEIAQAVAVAVEDKALRDRIYEKCMEKFDGETNTLWMHLEADSKLKTSGGWNKRIDAELGKGRKNATVKSIGNVDAAIKKFEKSLNTPLHLFWAFPQNWDKKTTPLVAFVPFDANPKTRTSIPAFDSKGNRFELDKDGAVAKQRPVLVLTLNERTQVNGKLKSSLEMPTMSMPTPAIPTSLIPKGSPSKTPSSRTNSASTLIVEQATIPGDYGSSDEWWEGTTEWIYTVVRYYYYGSPNFYSQWGTRSSHFIGTRPIGYPYSNYPTYTLNHAHTITDQWAITLQIQVSFYEDDFTANSWDIFDDHYETTTFEASPVTGQWEPMTSTPIGMAVYSIQ